MAKIKIDLDPKGPLTFEREVAIPTPSGKPLKITFTFMHRSREDMAALQDEYRAKGRDQLLELQEEMTQDKKGREKAEAAGDVYVPDVRPIAGDVPKVIAENVEAVMRVATGWNLDYEFNEDNLTKLFRLYARAARTIVDDYSVSMTEGRLGN